MRRLIFGLVLGAVTTLIAGGMLLANYPGERLVSFFRSAFGMGPARIDISQPTVVRQIRQLERLETVVYAMEKLISAQHESPYLPKFLAGDRLLLIAHGEVIAGVDLRKIRPQDVVISGRAIRLQLPKAEVFTIRIDNQRTRVYSRDTGLFSAVDPNLETEVRREGERQIHEAALKDGILKTAEQNARSTLTSLLKGFGFERADVAGN